MPKEDSSPPKDVLEHQDKAAGRKTPRKIQWLDENGRRPSEDTFHRVLDPSGEDPEAFNALADALEKHRQRSAPTGGPSPLSKVHYYPQRPEIQDTTTTDAHISDYGPGSEDDSDRGSDSGVDTSASTPGRSPRSSPPPLPARSMINAPVYKDEEAGLPMEHDLTWYAERQAERMVQALRRRIRRGERVQARREEAAAAVPHDNTSADVQLPMEELSPFPHDPMGGEDRGVLEGRKENRQEGRHGILSTLLRLREPPSSDDTSSYVSSTTPSGRESPAKDWYSDSKGHRERDRDIKQDADGRFDDQVRKRSRVPRPRANIPSLGMVPRPAQARSGAGVFGPLIAATGSLAGVASPHRATLQPNLKRPGYGLSRYSAENVPSERTDPSYFDRVSTFADHTATPSRPQSPTSAAPSVREGGGDKKKAFRLPNLSMESLRSSRRSSGYNTPTSYSAASDREPEDHHALRHRRTKEAKRRKRRKDEVFITKHIAQIIQREEFILKLTRAMMMFGSPTHRLQPQIQSAARVLDINLSFLYLPEVALLSFEDTATGTSYVKFIRQPSALDLGKLTDAYRLYWKVIHDKLSVADASASLDTLMLKPPLYHGWQVVLIGGLCSTWICTVSFAGSFIDAVICFPLGAILVVVQMLSVRNILFSHVFEITITMFSSLIAAALAASHKFCYSAVASSSVVLILPGFLVLNASLELVSRNMISGSIRICYAIVYALFLGFGFTMGAEIYRIITGREIVGSEDYVCSTAHNPHGPWYQRTPSKMWAFLTVPMFSLFLSLKNGARWKPRELPVLVSISCAGWVTNYFTGTKFPGQNEIPAAVGAFAVGIIANIYARLFSGNAFVVMITGILFQLPSGLGTGGLLTFASQQTSGSINSYIAGFQTAGKLVTVAIGLAIGLALSLVCTYPIQSKKREAGIFSM